MSKAIKQTAFNGYELAFVVRHSGLSRSSGHILAQCANLAACTSDYFIHKSHRVIAEETGYSVSTVVRAFREAVSRGLLSCTAIIDERSNARKANLYRFTPRYLAFVSRVKSKLVDAGLKITSSIRKVKQLVDQVLALSPPCQSDKPSPCQNDIANNKRTPSRTTKGDHSGEPEAQQSTMTNTQLAHDVAAAKAAAANNRAKTAKLERHQQHEALERQARKYAFLRNRKDADLSFSGDYGDVPNTGRLSDVLDAVLKKRSEERYTVAKGFRS